MIILFFISINSFSNEIISPYQLVNDNYKTVIGSEKTIENMPKVRSQGALGLCYAFSAATLFQKFWCDDYNNKNCAAIRLEDTISPIGITGFKNALLSEKNSMGKFDKKDRRTFAHTFLAESIVDPVNNSGAWLLDNASFHNSFCSEISFPYEEFLEFSKFKSLSPKAAQDAMIKLADNKISALKRIYHKYHNEELAKELCVECIREVKNIVPININTDDERDWPIQNAFTKKSFEEFVFLAFFSFCKKKVKFSTATMDYFPKVTKQGLTESEYNLNINHPVKVELMNQIKKVINNNVPLQAGFCAGKKGNECIGGHVAVISGYKKVCNESNHCIDMLKIHNSYGEAWQVKHNDGWIIADNFLNSFWGTNVKNTIGAGHLTWISKGSIN